MRSRSGSIGAGAIALVVGLGLSAPAAAGWPQWRGPDRSGSSPEKGLPGSWSPAGENLAWKAPFGGRSTPVIHGDHLYLLTGGGEGPTEHERVLCLSADDGRLLWEHPLPIFLTDIPSNRIGWSSPAVDDETGNVYAHGIQGLFVALDRDGRLLWSRSFTEEFGKFSGYGGRVQTPLIDEDLVIVSFLNAGWGDQGRMWHRFVAFDKRSGEVRWWSAPGGPPLDTNYSTPAIAVIDGVRLLIGGGGDGAVHALKVRTGEPVWSFRLSKRGINPSIIVDGTRVYAAHSEENIDTTTMGRVVAIDGTGRGDVTGSKEIWRIDGLQVGYASPAFHAGRIYVVDNSANLECLDSRDGKRLWEHSLGTVGKGSPVWADGKIYVAEVNGHFHVLEDGEKGPRSLDVEEFHAADGTIVELNGSPAVAGGRVYFSTRDETYAIGAKARAPDGAVSATGAASGAVPAPGPAARLQVVPADVLLAPGEKVRFRGRTFDEKGNPVGDAKEIVLAAKGLRGSISGPEFAAAPEATFQAGVLEARSGDLAAAVRVRVTPRRAVAEDFEGFAPGSLPPGWIGLSPLKFRIVERDGGRVLEKRADDPKFLRGDVYVGRSDAKGLTVQADVLGTAARRNLPDFGIMGSRTTFYLTRDARDRKPVARVVAWLPMPRLQKDAPFDWKTDVWYTMKMRIDPAGNGGVVRAKIWPREEPEPGSWTVEMEDPLPTLEGAAGFTAFTPGITERSPGPAVFFDNFRIIEEK